jgi:hypothetical protein
VTTITCKLCQREGPAAKAHVIPDGFFARVLDDEHTYLEVPADTPNSSITRQSGPWDRRLLCQECERTYAYLDGYLIQTLRDGLGQSWRFDLSELPPVLLLQTDCPRLRSALLFVLWRVLASDRPMFAAVTDPVCEETLRTYILSGNTPADHTYPIILYRYDQGAGLRTNDGIEYSLDSRELMINPCIRPSFDGRKAVELPLGEYNAFVAIDDASLSGVWRTLSICDAGPVWILLRPFANSPNLRFIIDRFAEERTRRSGTL